MIGLVLITHVDLATSLLRSAVMIYGKAENCECVEVSPMQQVDDVMNSVTQAVEKVSKDGAIIMSDMFGGTPSNMAMSFLQEGKIEVLTGVNLTMVVEFLSKRERLPFNELVDKIKKAGREGIISAGDFLK